MKPRLLIALCVGLAAPLAHAQTSTPAPAPAAPAPAPGTSPTPAPAPAQAAAPTQPATAPAPGQTAASAAQGSSGPSSGQPAPATTDPAVTGTTGPTTTPQTSTSGGAANVPADNAQLNDSIAAQNAARQGGFGGTRDNALAERQRQTTQFATAPAAAAPANARNGAVYVAPTPGSSAALNPADRGPVPGSDYANASGVTSNVYIVRAIPQPSPTGGGGVAVAGAAPPRSAPTGAGNASAANGSGARPPAAGTRTADSTDARTTRIYTYGPGGGDNVVGMMRLAEMQGQFRYSRGDRARSERKRQQASAGPRRR